MLVPLGFLLKAHLSTALKSIELEIKLKKVTYQHRGQIRVSGNLAALGHYIL